MIRFGRTVLILSIAALGGLVPIRAAADSGGITVTPVDPGGLDAPRIGVGIDNPGHDGNSGATGASSGGGGPRCHYEPEPELQDYTKGLRDWLPPSDLVEPALYSRHCDNEPVVHLVWLDNAPPTNTDQPPTAAELASRAYGELALPTPTPLHSPDLRVNGQSAVLVGEHTWIWAEPTTWQPQSKRVSAGTTWAQVTATPTELVFTPGDGTPPIRCPGGGTPFNTAQAPHAASPDCDHVYTNPPATPDHGAIADYQIVWHVTWTGSDQGTPTSGTLPDQVSRTQQAFMITESQAVVTRSR